MVAYYISLLERNLPTCQTRTIALQTEQIEKALFIFFIYDIGNNFGLLNLLVISGLHDLIINSGTTHDHATKITDPNSKKLFNFRSRC